MWINHKFCAMVACHFNFQFQVLTLLKGTKELVWFNLLWIYPTLIFARNGYIPQPRTKLKWTVQGLKLNGLIQRKQFLLVFLNVNNGYVGGLKTQHICFINLLMNLILLRRLWCQQPILLRMSIPPCGFLLKMVARWKQTCTLPLWMPC
jgi:hypothetical protein